MSYRASRVDFDLLGDQPLSGIDDWRQNQAGGLFRRIVETLLGVLAFILFLLYPAVFLFL